MASVRNMLLNELLDELTNPLSALTDQNFGIGLLTAQITQKVNLDVQQFQPEEVSVKVVDGFLVVEAKHEERQDKHGFISRSFTRRYKLPKDINQDAIVSSLSSDGVLTISATVKNQLPSGERQIPITQTNQPALKKVKSDLPVENGKGDKMEA